MTRAERAVVVGASIGGLTAAETLRQEGFDGEILLIGEERHAPYTRPPLSKQILMGEWEPHQASIRTAAETASLGIDLRTSCTALALDVPSRVMRTSSGDIAFDELVVATGSEARRHPLLPRALVLRTVDDALALRDGLRRAGRIGVVGAGVLGSEIASAARKHGAEVAVVGRSAALTFGAVGGLLSARLAALHDEHGVELLLGAEVVGADQGAHGTRLDLAGGRSETFDLLVAVIGSTPRTRWLRSSGLAVEDGVVCDSAGRAAPGVSAVGDVAAWADPFTGRPTRVEHQSSAIEQAIAVASSIVHGTPATPPTPLFWSEIHGARIHAYGRFDPALPLTDPDGGSPLDAPVLMSRDSDGTVRGVVGWNAPPRAFRSARAAVRAAPPTLVTTP